MNRTLDNTKLEELMKSPENQEELTEELKNSQLILPVVFSENMFEGIENAKEGDIFQPKGPSGFDINFLTDSEGRKVITLFTSNEIMEKIGLRSSAMVMYIPDLANMIKRSENDYEYIAINPFTENSIEMPIIPFISIFSTKEDEPIKINLDNPKSIGYRIFKTAYENSNIYVHDINLPKEFEEKYEIGALIKERAFVDMTNKIGQMTTSHRYTIISNHVADFSQFEEGTNWNLHTANRDSKFKVLDLYKFNEKTQILLLHLIDDLEEFFIDNATIDKEYVKLAREIFENSFEEEVIKEVNSPLWLERCSFPIGIDNEGNLWDLYE